MTRGGLTATGRKQTRPSEVCNQFIYVNPAKGVVIVKLSASRRYGLTNDETSYREYETLDMLRAIAGAA